MPQMLSWWACGWGVEVLRLVSCTRQPPRQLTSWRPPVHLPVRPPARLPVRPSRSAVRCGSWRGWRWRGTTASACAASCCLAGSAAATCSATGASACPATTTRLKTCTASAARPCRRRLCPAARRGRAARTRAPESTRAATQVRPCDLRGAGQTGNFSFLLLRSCKRHHCVATQRLSPHPRAFSPTQPRRPLPLTRRDRRGVGLVAHKCHYEEKCPPCAVLVGRRCHCGSCKLPVGSIQSAAGARCVAVRTCCVAAAL